MTSGRAGTPPKDHNVGLEEIKAYLEYARENIERSRMLFKMGDLRYALFSANEGLELCIKAHMLHYGIIDRAVAAGHFPYLAAVKKMEECTMSIIKKNPIDKKRLEEAHESLGTLKEAFKMMMEKELQVPLWKLSLGMPLFDDERGAVDKCQGKLSSWCEKISKIEGESWIHHGQDHDDSSPAGQAELCAGVLETRKDKNGWNSGSWLGSLPGGDDIDRSRIPAAKPIFPLAWLFQHGVIAFSFAHQQISRYPTRIDGIDSRKVYMENKDGVKNLLEKIYDVTETLSNHLERGDPLLAQYAAEMGIDVEDLLP